jgi:hypothetical protein
MSSSPSRAIWFHPLSVSEPGKISATFSAADEGTAHKATTSNATHRNALPMLKLLLPP